MVGFIASETKKIIFKCCERYAAGNSRNLDEIQLIMSLNPEPTDEPSLNKFDICEEYKKKQSLTIWEVLNVKPGLDFLGYSRLAPPFIYKALIRFSKKYKIELDKVSILCQPYLSERRKKEVQLALYNGYDYVAQVLFYPQEDENGDIIDTEAEYLFSDEDFEMPK